MAMSNLLNGKLKEIELDNFKSYRGKQRVGPFSNFTAIIGPNGSGKSNLMDAISFVLGEQTKNLRVKRLNDLIHGANFGMPLSRTASVTAVILAPDGSELRFSRIIHNNTSEYKVNDRVVKLDEYAANLEKLSIFIKAKNFLVFQGTVETIAMKNAKERCQMFEEISKSIELKEDYDRAREEVRRLEEETSSSLHLKKNIVAERREAKKEIDDAALYKKLKNQLQDKRIELQLLKLYYNEVETKQIQKDLAEKKSEFEEQKGERLEIEEKIKSRRKTLAKLHREQSGIEQEIKKCEQEISRKKPDHIRNYQKLKHLQDKQKESKRSYESAKQQHNANVEEVHQLEEHISRIKEMKRDYELKQSQMSLEAGRSFELQQSQLQDYHKLKQKVAEKTSHLSAILDALNREYNEQKDIYDALERRNNEISSSQKRKESEVNESKKRLQKLREYIESSNRAINEQKQAEETIRAEVETATVRITEINRDLEAVVSQLGEARVEKHESSRAAKKQELIENLKRLFPGVHGRLLEMCQPSHRKYQVAITKVLGKYMDAIVCDTQKTAKDCIQYMKDQRIEPETFLPLDFLDVRPIDEQLREIRDPPNVHLVLDVIQFEPPIIKKALQFACGNALVCETIEHARTVAFNTGERKKTVSLEGTLFQRSGVISGGASDLKARARRWDEKQINSLVTKRDNLQDELKEQLKKKRKEAELRTIQSQIKGLETRLKYTQKDKNSIEEKLLVSNEDEVSRMKKEMDEIDERIKRCTTKMQELQININSEKQKMDSAEDDVFKDFCDDIGVDNIRQYEERELIIAKERDLKLLEFHNQLQKLDNQLEYEKSRNTQALVNKCAESMRLEKEEIDRVIEQENQIKQEMEELERKRADLEEKLTDSKQNCESVDGEMADFQRSRTVKQRDCLKVEKEISQIETRLESRKADRHSLIQAAKMEDLDLPVKDGSITIYDTTATQNSQHGASNEEEIIDLLDLGSAEMSKLFRQEEKIQFDYKRLDKPLRHLSSESEVNRKIEQLHGEVDSRVAELHRYQVPPNLRAGEKLTSVEERLRATESQFEDARQRARNAKMNFERVKRGRFDRFQQCFDMVVDCIDGIYKNLARNPGAQASLIPTNPEEPYLDEIQFQCVAPGKRFQHMDSLSGGEKTIAALALLFATHTCNMAPFFVLDEIDAALDNTNIGKVASFIREYSGSQAQIIVISLKEEFYSKADSLIGILPTTEGSLLVSQVFCLDLSLYVDAEEN